MNAVVIGKFQAQPLAFCSRKVTNGKSHDILILIARLYRKLNSINIHVTDTSCSFMVAGQVPRLCNFFMLNSFEHEISTAHKN